MNMVIVGIDEVGRGCWAGPLVAGAVILDSPIAELRDSKKLSKQRREELSPIILANAIATGIGWVWPDELDTHGVTWAVQIAMQRALDKISMQYDQIIVDGNINYFPNNPKATAIIKADDSVPEVSAASIIAKVARDNYMTRIAFRYPGYGFETHVGYGTPLHIAALQRLGVSDIHRKSYKPIQLLLTA